MAKKRNSKVDRHSNSEAAIERAVKSEGKVQAAETIGAIVGPSSTGKSTLATQYLQQIGESGGNAELSLWGLPMILIVDNGPHFLPSVERMWPAFAGLGFTVKRKAEKHGKP